MWNLFSINCKKKEKFWLKQISVLARLSLLFVLVYGGCNFITSLRGDAGILVFEWERHIPFLSIFILPYMSIYLFFIGAPFLCSSNSELKIFARRVMVGILIAGIFFLITPFQFAFSRPQVTGWLGPIYDFFHSFDNPYNLFPSLHIFLQAILSHKYAEKTHGLLRIGVYVWFLLIGLSTLLTYQHHVADVVSGFFVAAFIFYFIPDKGKSVNSIIFSRVGLYYLMGSLSLVFLSVLLPPWGLVFLWPALTFGIVGVAYFRTDSNLTRKHKGKIPLSTKIALAPWLIGQRLTAIYYQRQCKSWNEVVPGICIGRILNEKGAQAVIKDGVTTVIDLTTEFSEAKLLLDQKYFNFQVLDLTAPSLSVLQQSVELIDEYKKNGVVYIHCKIGYSRSAAVAGAYLLYTGKAKTVKDAVNHLRMVRESIVVRPEIFGVLDAYLKSIKSLHGEDMASRYNLEYKKAI